MKKLKLLSLLFIVPAALLSSCETQESGRTKNKNIEQFKIERSDWEAVYDPSNFCMNTNFVHEIKQTMSNGDLRATERFETDNGKLHVTQTYYYCDYPEIGYVVSDELRGQVETQLEFYCEFVEINDDRIATIRGYQQTSEGWKAVETTESVDAFLLDCGLFPLDFEHFTFDKIKNQYYAESYTHEIGIADFYLSSLNLSKCYVDFKNKLPVGYEFDFTSINADGTNNLTAHESGKFFDYGKVKVEFPSA